MTNQRIGFTKEFDLSVIEKAIRSDIMDYPTLKLVPVLNPQGMDDAWCRQQLSDEWKMMNTRRKSVGEFPHSIPPSSLVILREDWEVDEKVRPTKAGQFTIALYHQTGAHQDAICRVELAFDPKLNKYLVYTTSAAGFQTVLEDISSLVAGFDYFADTVGHPTILEWNIYSHLAWNGISIKPEPPETITDWSVYGQAGVFS